MSQDKAPWEARKAHMTLGVVMERRPGATRWVAHVWKPVSVFVGAPPVEPGRALRAGEDWAQFYAGGASLELHRADADGYADNMASPRPSIYVVMTPARGEMPWRLQLVTASPYEAEAYMVGGDNLIEPVPMPAEVTTFIAAFVKTHYKPEPFKKRQRDQPPALKEEKFGKEPIFARDRRRPDRES